MPGEFGCYKVAGSFFILCGGKKVRIPTIDAMHAMGYVELDFQEVPDLNDFPTFDIPSASPTPGSLVFPPDHPSELSFDQTHYALKVNTSQVLRSLSHTTVPGGFKEIQLVEIRG